VKIFSIPLNPKLTEQQFYTFLEFCKEYKDYIYDIYFTCRIDPFLQDAMGDVFVQKDAHQFAIETALYVQKETGITVSATFNNISVRASQKNLETWIKNFKPLYDAGIRSCTLPHTHWMLTKQVKHNFPELFVKNTILRAVKEPREVAALAQAGFNYVNLDRVLMRDHDRLREIKRVKDKYGIKLSLLANEGCVGGCPVMDEHYHFNNTRTTGNQYFTDPISRVSCPKWQTQDSAVQLTNANFPPWREDWLEFLELGIDTIKMHGRENSNRLNETMDIIRRFANKEEILFSGFEPYIEDTNLIEKPINAWRQKIKTCKFNCWDCDYCTKVWRAKGNKNNKKVEKVAQLLIDTVNQPIGDTVEGITSDKMKQLLNGIGKISTGYLEVGVLNGGTFCATIKNNNLKAYAVDHWQEQTKSANGKVDLESSKEKFIENAKKYKGNNTLKVFNSHFLQVDKTDVGNIDFFFYDADHSEEANYQAVMYFADKLVDEAVLIFDDANFDGVVSGAKRGIADAGLEVMYDKILLNDLEDPDMWWNGFYLAIVKK
jgi:predicted O-methyltransferase YrrM